MSTAEVMGLLEGLPEKLKTLYGKKLKAVILYGSAARGTAEEESDIDILILLDIPADELGGYEAGLCDISTDMALEHFKVFSMIDASWQEFHAWKDISPFYKNIVKEGVVLYAA